MFGAEVCCTDSLGWGGHLALGFAQTRDGDILPGTHSIKQADVRESDTVKRTPEIASMHAKRHVATEGTRMWAIFDAGKVIVLETASLGFRRSNSWGLHDTLKTRASLGTVAPALAADGAQTHVSLTSTVKQQAGGRLFPFINLYGQAQGARILTPHDWQREGASYQSLPPFPPTAAQAAAEVAATGLEPLPASGAPPISRLLTHINQVDPPRTDGEWHVVSADQAVANSGRARKVFARLRPIYTHQRLWGIVSKAKQAPAACPDPFVQGTSHGGPVPDWASLPATFAAAQAGASVPTTRTADLERLLRHILPPRLFLFADEKAAGFQVGREGSDGGAKTEVWQPMQVNEAASLVPLAEVSSRSLTASESERESELKVAITAALEHMRVTAAAIAAAQLAAGKARSQKVPEQLATLQSDLDQGLCKELARLRIGAWIRRLLRASTGLGPWAERRSLVLWRKAARPGGALERRRRRAERLAAQAE